MKAKTLNDKEYPVSSGEVLTLSCTDGFQLKGSTTLTCQNEGYYFHDESEDEPRCIPSEQSGIEYTTTTSFVFLIALECVFYNKFV